MNTSTGLSFKDIMTMKRQAVELAGHRCQGSNKHPECRAREGIAHPVTDKPVRLSVIHDAPGQPTVEGMIVMCDRCALTYEFKVHGSNDWRQKRASMRNAEMFDIPERKF